jgi:hypothetical protein
MHAALVPSSVSIVLTDGFDDDTHDKALFDEYRAERWPATDLLGLWLWVSAATLATFIAHPATGDH